MWIFVTILSKLNSIIERLNRIMALLDNLNAAVARETTVEQSAITLIQGIAKQLADLIAKSGNTVDPAELQKIVDGMNANQDALAAAVTANTPAAPTV